MYVNKKMDILHFIKYMDEPRCYDIKWNNTAIEKWVLHSRSHMETKSIDLLEAENRIVVTRSLSKLRKYGEILVKTKRY